MILITRPIRNFQYAGFSFLILFMMAGQGSRLVHAVPLEPEACLKAQSEQKKLKDVGVGEYIDKGPPSENLSQDRLENITRWFELQEQILFRCPGTKPLKIEKSTPKDTPKAKNTVKKKKKSSGS